jgi:F-type H+-transporting ATPase subunit O
MAPTLSDTDKSQIIAELEKHTGGADKSGTVKNFLQALGENNRLGLLEGVCEKFGTLMSAAKGEVELTVTSASVNSPDFTLSESHSRAASTSKFRYEPKKLT